MKLLLKSAIVAGIILVMIFGPSLYGWKRCNSLPRVEIDPNLNKSDCMEIKAAMEQSDCWPTLPKLGYWEWLESTMSPDVGVQWGHVVFKKHENGIRVTYDFNSGYGMGGCFDAVYEKRNGTWLVTE